METNENPQFAALRDDIVNSTIKKWTNSMSQDDVDQLEKELPELVVDETMTKKVFRLVDLLFREGLQPLSKERKPELELFDAHLSKVDEKIYLYMKQEIEMMQIMLFSTIDDLNTMPIEDMRDHAKKALDAGDINTHKWARVRSISKSKTLHNIDVEDGKRFAEIIVEINY